MKKVLTIILLLLVVVLVSYISIALLVYDGDFMLGLFTTPPSTPSTSVLVPSPSTPISAPKYPFLIEEYYGEFFNPLPDNATNLATGETIIRVIPVDAGLYSDSYKVGWYNEIGNRSRLVPAQRLSDIDLQNNNSYIYIGMYKDENDFVHEQGFTRSNDIFQIIESSNGEYQWVGIWKNTFEDNYEFEIVWDNGEGLVDFHPQLLRYPHATQEFIQSLPVIEFIYNTVQWISPTLQVEGGKVISIYGDMIWDSSFRYTAAPSPSPSPSPSLWELADGRSYITNGYIIDVRQFTLREDESQIVFDYDSIHPSLPFPWEMFKISDDMFLSTDSDGIITINFKEPYWDLDGWRILDDAAVMIHYDNWLKFREEVRARLSDADNEMTKALIIEEITGFNGDALIDFMNNNNDDYESLFDPNFVSPSLMINNYTSLLPVEAGGSRLPRILSEESRATLRTLGYDVELEFISSSEIGISAEQWNFDYHESLKLIITDFVDSREITYDNESSIELAENEHLKIADVYIYIVR